MADETRPAMHYVLTAVVPTHGLSAPTPPLAITAPIALGDPYTRVTLAVGQLAFSVEWIMLMDALRRVCPKFWAALPGYDLDKVEFEAMLARIKPEEPTSPSQEKPNASTSRDRADQEGPSPPTDNSADGAVVRGFRATAFEELGCEAPTETKG